jgi:hypothetical protein
MVEASFMSTASPPDVRRDPLVMPRVEDAMCPASQHSTDGRTRWVVF